MVKKSLTNILDSRADDLLVNQDRLALVCLRSAVSRYAKVLDSQPGFGISEVVIKNKVLHVTAPPHVRQYLLIHEKEILDQVSTCMAEKSPSTSQPVYLEKIN